MKYNHIHPHFLAPTPPDSPLPTSISQLPTLFVISLNNPLSPYSKA